MSTIHEINLIPTDAYRRDTYGVILESESRHTVTGRGVHNPGYDHRIDVWENRPARDGSGGLVDPHGKRTEDTYSYLLKACATVITARREVRPPQGPTLKIGDVVRLKISGYSIGEYQIRAKMLHDPHLTLVDTASSASRQHFIDTGEYLAPGESE